MLTLPAPAKLNLDLHIEGQREDGMHLLRSTMVLIDLCDTVTLTARTDGKIVCDWQHDDVAADGDICCLAAEKLKAQSAGQCSGVSIHVDKKIPVGSGLGGGSSNAVTTLWGLNQLWTLNLSREKLTEIAASLGADLPFFFYGRAATVSGIGSHFTEKKVENNSYLLLYPNTKATTAKVYNQYDRLTNEQKIDRIPLALKKSSNDLTAAAISLYPQIAEAAQLLYNIAGEARLSGSGATLFAEFTNEAQARKAQSQLPAETLSVVANLLSEHPLQRYTWGVAKW